MTKLPAYDDLPIDHTNAPDSSAWGVFGEDDNLGTLNLLTEERVSKAAQDNVKRGAVFSLNWKLELPWPPPHNREAIQHRIKDRFENKGFGTVHNNWFDDVLEINTQSSSQWDGLLHVGNMETGKFYNGVSPDALSQQQHSHRLGIHHMARRGIASRAVLLDYERWASKQGKQVDPFTCHAITVDELKQVANDQHVDFMPGDILLLRTGWMAAYERDSKAVDFKNLQCIGVEASESMYSFIWDNHFAAVASDNVAFEAYPIKDWANSCHTHFLAGFGMPIGEMFYLEKLAEDCAKDGRYSCFFTSAPLNKYQGVATPPNALALK